MLYIAQTGYARSFPKFALAPGDAPERFVLVAKTGDVVLQGKATPAKTGSLCSQSLRWLDFSACVSLGDYELQCGTWSMPVRIVEDAFHETAQALLKGFYFQRASLELLPQYAGPWARPAGHPDTEVLVHASAACAGRPEGFVISAPKGWYDAGDYNKYIVNSGISTATLLAAFADFSGVSRLRVNIPESGGGLPDVLAEARWNLDWMLSMQDPADGGVYAKLTNLRFDGMELPHRCVSPRYVVQKTTAAALDFAACLAMASVVYQPFANDFAATCLKAARQAYAWAGRHPDILYSQPADVFTGQYGDSDLDDEFYWAECELFVATGDTAYLVRARNRPILARVPDWQNVALLGTMALLRADASLVTEGERLRQLAEELCERAQDEVLRIPMKSTDFVWGSNGVLANQGMVLLFAARVAERRGDDPAVIDRYRRCAADAFYYLLGRNPMGMSYVTGCGLHWPRDIHHRPSQGDAVDEPVPGLLVGGPNPGQQDAAKCPPYPSQEPALSYLDHVRSCASNEIAINWNAPAFYLAAGLCHTLPIPV